MKVVILAGGFGTRIAEETSSKPKPMVEIGGRPILWHILKHFSNYGYDDFVIALGYKGEVIKRYFLEYADLNGNLTIKLKNGKCDVTHREHDDWTIHLEDTGSNTLTGGRIKKLGHLLSDDYFMVTYGDGLSDVPIDKLIEFHKNSNKLATVTAVRPPARFGNIAITGDEVISFEEKIQVNEGWINGGYLVFNKEVLNLINHSKNSLESDILERLAQDKQLAAYCHEGFWQCMDNIRDLKLLEHLWDSGKAPWTTWNKE